MQRRNSAPILITACACTAILAVALTSGAQSEPRQRKDAEERVFEVRNVSVSILRPPKDVYAFAAEVENLPKWAAGLGDTIRRIDGEWVADGPLGRAKVRMAARNELGVLDHDVVLVASGATVHNPLRVVPNGAGSTVIFTLTRRPGVTPQQFEQDAKAVERDLKTLKKLLEGS